VTVSAASGTSLAGFKNSSVRSGTGQGFFDPGLMSLEVLHFTFVLFCCRACGKRPKVPAFAAGVGFSGVEAILTGFQFSDHTGSFAREVP
jgi:hypothetical protein